MATIHVYLRHVQETCGYETRDARDMWLRYTCASQDACQISITTSRTVNVQHARIISMGKVTYRGQHRADIENENNKLFKFYELNQSKCSNPAMCLPLQKYLMFHID